MLRNLHPPSCTKQTGLPGTCQLSTHPRALSVVCHNDNATSNGSTASQPADASNKAAILARIARAKQYKTKSDEVPSSTGSQDAVQSQPSTATMPVPGAPRQVDWGAVATFIDSGGKAADGSDSIQALQSMQQGSQPGNDELQAIAAQRAARFEAAKDKMSDEYTPIDSDNKAFVSMMLNATQASGRGNAAQAALPLQAVLSDQSDTLAEGLDASTMSMEEFTAAKEAKLRSLGAEILTVDPTYQAGSSTDDDTAASTSRKQTGGEIVSVVRNPDAASMLTSRRFAVEPASVPSQTGSSDNQGEGNGSGDQQEKSETYAPTVSTWGVFPRPKDISATYGGGRNIKPGQALETADQKAAREAAYAAAIKAYKAKAGLEVDEEAEAQAQELYDQGMEFFKAADLKSAYFKFQDALALVPIKSRVGGLAGLQAAVILDSQGESEAAQKLYRQLQGHAVAHVSRKAKQMLFGFKAAKFLKADTISYAAKNKDFDRYFRPMADRNKIWVPTEEEREEAERGARTAAVIAVTVILGPLALMAALVAQGRGMI